MQSSLVRFHDVLHQRSALEEVGMKFDGIPQYKVYDMCKHYIDTKGERLLHSTTK